MSVQLGILLILASHPNGAASIAAINADTRLLSGADWSRKLRKLARGTGPINIFGDGLVVRDADGWRLTDAGRQLVASLDAIAADERGAAEVQGGLRLVASQPVPRTATAARAQLTLAKTA